MNDTSCSVSKTEIDVQVLLMKDLNIVHFPVHLGRFLPSLHSLMAVNSSIEFIRRENFEFLEKLTFLNLENYNIETVAEDAFTDLTKLDIIVLNKWKSNHERVRRSSRNLKSLM